MKILTIVGARPQFIKAAALSRELKRHKGISEVIVHTGQHFDKNMSDVFFEEMDIPKPHYHLHINSLSHGAMTGRMLEEVEKVIVKENPDWVLVYGDTNSTLAGALAATKLHVKVAHVEAGLRSFNTQMPEEINRILTDRISQVLFCPTNTAIANLKREGFDNIDCEILKVGDVMQDAALFYAERSRKPDFDIPDEFALATIHRAENTDDPAKLSSIIDAFNEIHASLPIVLPLHPRTRNYIKKFELNPEFILIDPVSYLEMVFLLKKCSLVMTDSGGLQKEAYFFSKNCMTIRDQTEWVELLDAGTNILVDATSKSDIVSKATIMRERKNDFSNELYGGGMACTKIVNTLKEWKKNS